jgi:hypothetical protein
VNNSIDRKKSVYDRHEAGESYSKISKDLGVSISRARQLNKEYEKHLRAIAYNVEFGDVSFSQGTLNCLRRNDIRNIEELKQKIINGFERRIPLRWYVGGEYIPNMGDKTWINEILPFLDSIGFEWSKYYKGSDTILKKLGRSLGIEPPQGPYKTKWSTNMPIKPGTYWACNMKYRKDIVDAIQVDLVEWDDGTSAMLCQRIGSDDWRDLDDYTHFIGPLQLPEPPKV